MNTAGEIVLFAIGVLCVVSFLVCVLSACIGRDTNWQESFSLSERVAYVGTDDMWYPGIRPQESCQSVWLVCHIRHWHGYG